MSLSPSFSLSHSVSLPSAHFSPLLVFWPLGINALATRGPLLVPVVAARCYLPSILRPSSPTFSHQRPRSAGLGREDGRKCQPQRPVYRKRHRAHVPVRGRPSSSLRAGAWPPRQIQDFIRTVLKDKKSIWEGGDQREKDFSPLPSSLSLSCLCNSTPTNIPSLWFSWRATNRGY